MTEQDQNLSKNQYFFDKWAKNYDRRSNQWWMKRFHLPVFKELLLNQNTKILDISCGTGELLKKLEGKAELYGVDLSEEMLTKARTKLSPKVKLRKADVHALPFKDNFFDYVISAEAFHHYYGQQKAVQEMVRITKTGGKVIVADINFFLKPIHWLFKRYEPGHVKINSKKEMKQLFEQAGLKIVGQKRNFAFAVMTVGEK
ncbi:MAG: methyltransferase domain-containing protein [Nanoarchaeota archaeon]|nr:methyltransferase domain-containing protein [Nanoarchaeota archaeon]